MLLTGSHVPAINDLMPLANLEELQALRMIGIAATNYDGSGDPIRYARVFSGAFELMENLNSIEIGDPSWSRDPVWEYPREISIRLPNVLVFSGNDCFRDGNRAGCR